MAKQIQTEISIYKVGKIINLDEIDIEILTITVSEKGHMIRQI